MLRAVCSPLFFALGALAILLVGMEAARPGFFLHDDNATWFAGAYAHDFRTLTQTGRIAEVNFYQYGGEPFLEQGQSGALYPPVYVASALALGVTGDLRWTIEWLAAMHLALALAGFYFWLRQGGMDAWLAALGGLVWALNPFVLILGASWIFVTYVVAWLPWLFWAVDGIFLGSDREPSRQAQAGPAETELVRGPATALGSAAVSKPDASPRSAQDDDLLKSGLRRPAQGLRGLPLHLPRAVTLGVIAGLMVLQGYVQWAAYAFLFAGIYGLFRIFAAGSWRVWVARTTCCPGARSAQEVAWDVESLQATSCAGTEVSVPAPGQQVVRATDSRGRVLLALAVAGLVAMALPLVLPMWHAVKESKVRAQPLSLLQELYYRVQFGDLLAAQVGFFRQHFLFDASTALFFCPALVLFPLAIVAFARGDAAMRRRLFPLILLAVMALFLSGSGYFLLNVVPLMQQFRWPFKIFVFAEFFLVAALVWSFGGELGRRTGRQARLSPSLQEEKESANPAEQKLVGGPATALGSAAASKPDVSPRSAQDDESLKSVLRRPAQGLRRLPLLALAIVLVLQVGVALAVHDSNFLSQATLPVSSADLPPGMDPAMGRVIAIDDGVPVADGYRFFTHAYGTWFQVPSLGGYNPLVSDRRLNFGLGLDVPNVFHQQITPELREKLESRAVRYWVIEANSLHLVQGRGAFGGLSGFRAVTGDAGRLILEDLAARPIAFNVTAPTVALPVRYAGNSLIVQLNHTPGIIAVSVGPTDGWWFRADGGAWKKPGYRDLRLYIAVSDRSRELEISYFDPRLRAGLWNSLVIIVLIALFSFLGWVERRRLDEPA